MDRKGITPVISIVLLLMITIALIGFAFVWFTRIFDIAATQSETQMGGVVGQGSKIITIDNAANISSQLQIDIRNIGTASVADTELSVYVNTVKKTWLSSFTLTAGSTGTGIINSPDYCNGATAIKIVGPSNIATYTC